MPRKVKDTLDAIFRPRSIAIIGASRKRQSIGREILRNLIDCEFAGPVYPVNPSAKAINSIQAFASLDDIPGPVDLAVIAVPRDLVLKIIDQCGRKGVKGLVMITAGFKEVGSEGAAIELQLKKKLHRYGMRMVGPNCMGIINTEPDIKMNTTFTAAVPQRGNVGFISQSGALGEIILADAAGSNLGIAMFVSVGNKTDVSGNDLLEYWEHNPDIQVVLMYLESFGEPHRFTTLARRLTRTKPIITVKAGRTPAGARAASSHTGSIVGLDVATESLLDQCGVLRVSSIEEMFTKAAALANQPLPQGDRIAIVTNAGGPGILCTDSVIGKGLTMAELSQKTRRALTRVLAPEASTRNPVDMIATADAERYRKTLRIIKKDPGVDGMIALFVSPIMIDAYEVARAIAEAADGEKPVLSVFMGKQRSREGIELLRQHKVPVYRFPEEAASAMEGMVRYKVLQDAPQGEELRFKVNRQAVRRVINAVRRKGRKDLTPDEVQKVLQAYGFPMARCKTVSSDAEAIAAAIEIGYPVVLKIASEKFSHKTDVGGVRVDLRNADEVHRAFKEMTTPLLRRDPRLKVTVQQMVRNGKEVILGMSKDPQFGPFLMFGLGGIFVEVMKDVSVRIHPLTDVGAKVMIERIKGYPLLAGARGEKGVSLPLIEDSLLRLSQMVGDHENDLLELDINPFIVTEDPAESFVVDARISLTD